VSPTNSKRHLNTRQFGRAQEKLATDFLKKRGLKLLMHNYQCKLGEIDLIMLDAKQQLVFVEVRYRRQQFFGSAVESVGTVKQKRIRRTAEHFRLTHPRYNHLMCRFDVIGITQASDSGDSVLDWIPNAFY